MRTYFSQILIRGSGFENSDPDQFFCGYPDQDPGDPN